MLNQWADLRNSSVFLKLNSIEIASAFASDVNSNMTGSHGVMVSTLDSESSDPSSNLGGT